MKILLFQGFLNTVQQLLEYLKAPPRKFCLELRNYATF